MNIDLLFTSGEPPGLEAGLVSDTGFRSPVAGVMFDMGTGLVTLEFADTDSIDLNIPVQESYLEHLFNLPAIHIGVIENGQITDYRQVPLVLMNDPFGGGNIGRLASKPRRSVAAFESFMRRCAQGQPAHRIDLGDESSASSVTGGGMSAAVLQYAPHLARQNALEAQRHLRHDPAPQAPGMGLGGRSGGGTVRRNPPPKRPPQDDETE